jgi:hypothetical protein
MKNFNSENSATSTALVPSVNSTNRNRLLSGVHIATSAPKPVPVSLARRHNETTALARANGINLPFLGYSPVFSETKMYFGEASDWALMNLNNDPLFNSQKNKLYAPKSVLAEIRTAVKAGIQLDSIYIAHEVPKGKLQLGKKISAELLAPPPSAKVQRRLNFIEKATRLWWKYVAEISAGAIVAPVAIAGAVAASPFAALSAGLDPVLLGVQFDPRWTHKGQPIGIWYYITAWDWSNVEV